MSANASTPREPGTFPIEEDAEAWAAATGYTPAEVAAAGCEPSAPDPGCYGCLGTGVLQWAGVEKVPCMCTQRCATHDRPMAGEPVCAVGEQAL